jgi:hypothetical protein
MKVKSSRTTRQKRRIVLLALYILKRYHGVLHPHKQRVLAFVRSAHLMHIPPGDENYGEAGEMRWENDLGWARLVLKDDGLLLMPEHGIWQISEAGQRDVEAWAQKIKQQTETMVDWVAEFKAHSEPAPDGDDDIHLEYVKYYFTEDTIRWGLKIAGEIKK